MVAALATAFALPPKTPTRLFLGVERSVCGRPWRDRLDERAAARALAIAQRHNVPELLARILAGRGVEADEVEAFLDPTVRRLMPDPHTVTAMEQAAQRLADAMLRGEQVAIFGDYDVDGATASALLARFLRICGVEPSSTFPTAFSKAMAPMSKRSARWPARRDASRHRRLRHHQHRGAGRGAAARHRRHRARSPSGRRGLAGCACVVNPNRLDDLSGLGHLAAVGLVFVAVVAVNRVLRTRGFWTRARPEPDLLGWLDIVALGTVADVVPLKGLNRAFVAKGLLALRRRDNAGLTALMDVARLSGRPSRFISASCSARASMPAAASAAPISASLLLRTDDPIEAARIAAELDRLNRERQAIEAAMLEEAEAEAHGRARLEEKGAVVVTAAAKLASGRRRACSRRG